MKPSPKPLSQKQKHRCYRLLMRQLMALFPEANSKGSSKLFREWGHLVRSILWPKSQHSTASPTSNPSSLGLDSIHPCVSVPARSQPM